MVMSIGWSSIAIPSWVFFGLFFLASIIHLIFCYLENEKMRHYTKIFPLMFLSFAAVFQFPGEWMIWAALICGMLGDLFLLGKKKKGLYFLIGVLFFFANHIFFAAEFISLTYPMELGFYIAYGAYVVVFSAVAGPLCYRVVKKMPLVAPLTIYFAMLSGNLLLSIFAASHSATPLLWISVAGEALFLASDIILGATLFGKDIKRRDFYIMITYLLAQFLISTGMGLTILVI